MYFDEEEIRRLEIKVGCLAIVAGGCLLVSGGVITWLLMR